MSRTKSVLDEYFQCNSGNFSSNNPHLAQYNYEHNKIDSVEYSSYHSKSINDRFTPNFKLSSGTYCISDSRKKNEIVYEYLNYMPRRSNTTIVADYGEQDLQGYFGETRDDLKNPTDYYTLEEYIEPKYCYMEHVPAEQSSSSRNKTIIYYETSDSDMEELDNNRNYQIKNEFKKTNFKYSMPVLFSPKRDFNKTKLASSHENSFDIPELGEKQSLTNKTTTTCTVSAQTSSLELQDNDKYLKEYNIKSTQTLELEEYMPRKKVCETGTQTSVAKYTNLIKFLTPRHKNVGFEATLRGIFNERVFWWFHNIILMLCENIYNFPLMGSTITWPKNAIQSKKFNSSTMPNSKQKNSTRARYSKRNKLKKFRENC